MAGIREHFDSKETARDAAREALLPRAISSVNTKWDKFVLVMRFTLPILALIIGAITISWPFMAETEVSFTLSRDDVARGEDKVHMRGMQYVGTDAINRLFRITAAEGLQENANAPRVRLEDIYAEMLLTPAEAAIEGSNPAFVKAETGIYRVKDSSLSLIGKVHLNSGNGYIIDMAGAEIDLQGKKAVGQGTIQGFSPLGELRADRLELDVIEASGIFIGNVKIRITPHKSSTQSTE